MGRFPLGTAAIIALVFFIIMPTIVTQILPGVQREQSRNKEGKLEDGVGDEDNVYSVSYGGRQPQSKPWIFVGIILLLIIYPAICMANGPLVGWSVMFLILMFFVFLINPEEKDQDKFVCGRVTWGRIHGGLAFLLFTYSYVIVVVLCYLELGGRYAWGSAWFTAGLGALYVMLLGRRLRCVPKEKKVWNHMDSYIERLFLIGLIVFFAFFPPSAQLVA